MYKFCIGYCIALMGGLIVLADSVPTLEHRTGTNGCHHNIEVWIWLKEQEEPYSCRKECVTE